MREPDWKRFGYSSLEAWIESKAGACPPDIWVAPWGNDSNPGTSALPLATIHAATSMVDNGGTVRLHRGDWPMPEPPPYPADDEAREVPDE